MPAKAKAPQDTDALEIDGIPTVAGLAKRSRDLAYKRADGRWQVTEAGQAVITQALRERAKHDLENGIWHGTSGAHPGPAPQPGLH